MHNLSRTITNDKLLIAVGILFIFAMILLTSAPGLHGAPAGTGDYYIVPDTPEMPDGNAYGASFKTSTPYVAVAEDATDAGLTVVNTNTLHTIDGIPEPEGQVTAVKFSANGHYLAVGGDHVTIIDSSASNPADWTVVQSTENEGGLVTSLAFSKNGDYLAVGYDGDSPVRVGLLDTSDWSAITDGGDPFDFGVDGEHLLDVTFTPDSQYLLLGLETGGDGPNLIAVNTDGWSVVEGVPQFDAITATAFSFSPNGHYLAVGLDFAFDDYSIGVMDTSDSNPANWTIVREFNPNETSSAWSVAFSPNGKTLAVAYRSSPYFGIINTSNSNPENWTGVDTSVSIGELPGGKAGNSGQGVSYSSDGTIIAVAEGGGAGLALIRTPTSATRHIPKPSSGSHSGPVVVPVTTDLSTDTSTSTSSASGSVAPTVPVRDLQLGMDGDDVKSLQLLLIAQNAGSKALALKGIGATGYFGTYTRDALAEYQAAHGITPAVGYFGALTRAQMKAAGLAGLWW